ncbi:hypothetical protein K504DRAFT_492271 [Pleomassaria siparia CBS 279.74]|uniref:Uncharacterized protein n=1 Tax=Pleomassaria siparia CBS 279.74 TaxID=1314801 RepID=A0A6G1K567_9PLEO|nr:hypothetical protein K504DRAFT_492271 [Pleomassaria siparia CBS 279.74]
MLSALRYDDMKAKIPAIKNLFTTRHYLQCAAECERLLTISRHDQIHPVHKACLHFYLALSHDSIAREASIKNRFSELDLAEKHYIAALAALTPSLSDSKKLEDIRECQSPTSSTSEEEVNSINRPSSATSLNSQTSMTSSETSYADDEDFFADWEHGSRNSVHYKHSSSQSAQDEYCLAPKLPNKRSDSIIIKPTERQSLYVEQFSADLSAFASMIELHLASVRELNEAPMSPNLRLSFARSRSSMIGSRPVSRNSVLQGDAAGMESLREHRKTMIFRPRFDPTSVRELCEEALSEL